MLQIDDQGVGPWRRYAGGSQRPGRPRATNDTSMNLTPAENKRMRRDRVRQSRHGGATGLVSPERSASGEWILGKMPAKTALFHSRSHEKEFGEVMLGVAVGIPIARHPPHKTVRAL